MRPFTDGRAAPTGTRPCLNPLETLLKLLTTPLSGQDYKNSVPQQTQIQALILSDFQEETELPLPTRTPLLAKSLKNATPRHFIDTRQDTTYTTHTIYKIPA